MDQPRSYNFPEHLLQDVGWDFESHVTYQSQSEFEEAVSRYRSEAEFDVGEEVVWQPDVAVLRSPRIGIDYYADPLGEEGAYHYIELVSDEGEAFTAGHLLFKIHNAAVGRLAESGHHWFEGLEFDRVSEDGVPIYLMIPGS